MRDNHEEMPEILDAYERESSYFGVIRLFLHGESPAFEFGLDAEAYKALRRILESKPLGEMPGISHRYFFARAYGGKLSEPKALTMSVRVETDRNAKTFVFPVPQSLLSNMLWFAELTNPIQAAHLIRIG
jgi:hypothetical protein